MTADLSFDPSIPVAHIASETDELVYRISHDLRASVRALQELPSWIQEDLDRAAVALPAATGRHLQLVTSHASRLDLMLTGLLEYSRIGRMQAIASIRPAEVLADVLDELALPDSARVRVALDGGRVQMGQDDLKRLFSIPIVNAVRFHPDKSPIIDVKGGPIPGGYWRFDVSDNGPGIPEDRRSHVLRPMTKLVSRDVDPGAGMGLAILRKIAETYGGEADVLAPPTGRGTLIRTTLAVN